MSRLRELAGAAWRLLPHLPLAAALLVADQLARRRPGKRRTARGAALRGVSVIVPERGTPDLLAETLAALEAALAPLSEPTQVIVVVNGAAREDYAALLQRWPGYDWQFHAAALGYNGAIEAGLRAARHGWSYLLNSDMRLAEDALAQLLPYRHAQVFAITSQIFFVDSTRRREETGWSDFHINPDFAEVYERDPGATRVARGNLYPGGGSSLCRTEVLRRYVADSRDYSPFYWEDADWGIRAWSEGWELVFCPASHAHHHHRGTVRRYFDEAEVARVIKRNELLFDLRHRWTRRHPLRTLDRLLRLDAPSRRELRGIGLAWRAFRSRLATERARQCGLRFERITKDYWYGPAPQGEQPRPRVILVTPFALFPPAHGGARRIAELVTRLSQQVDFFLLGDEASLYGAASEPWLQHFRGAQLLEGRGDRAGEPPLDFPARLRRHAWPGLRAELATRIAQFQPDIVQVEFMELVELADMHTAQQRWLLCLHDVYVSAQGDGADDALQRAAIARYDAVVVCSDEDAALLAPQPASLIGNGAIDRRAGYTPSPDGLLLFMGPFRYAQNRSGILAFIEQAWPALRAEFPQLRLRILGGVESAAVAEQDARLRQPGIELVSAFVDPAPHLAECSLSINPQMDIRGSSIKLIESLLAGRVCASTADGARGFAAAGLQGLRSSSDIAGMAATIAPLLRDSALRHTLECADTDILENFTWDAMAARQREVYRTLCPESTP
ncbi:GT2 family glycosyltransferase [Tahibacter aquaticus]|uniref:GT2 family glycosyltransferase n=1 Tax=Tahibacter aquaticus TaxID=520092 RepID=A0A4R6YPA9_9GAMM|nr:glycosyltransferase [Tahibacter aquaticus]TDR39417.1 GT2 family glycosyltransferase [Tahibacter aquaticus]